MTWEDPLKIGRNKPKYSIKDEFSGELPGIIQNMILADCFSNMALAIIGQGEKVNYDVKYAFLGIKSSEFQNYVDFIDMLGKISSGLDMPFVSLLEMHFLNAPDKYKIFLHHFKLFKEANINPIYGRLMEGDSYLRTLTLGAFESKITQGLSDSEITKREEEISCILDYLGPCVEKERDNIEDYGEDMMMAFYESAVKLNPRLWTSRDCKCFKSVLLSEVFMKILSEHIGWLKIGYLQVMYGG